MSDFSSNPPVNIQDSFGNSLTVSNPLPVLISESTPGTAVNQYNTTVSLVVGTSTTHSYILPTGVTFTGKMFWASGSGKIRADVQLYNGTSATTYWTGFNSSSMPNISINLDLLSISESGTGSAIYIVITNEDSVAFDVFSTISGTIN